MTEGKQCHFYDLSLLQGTRTPTVSSSIGLFKNSNNDFNLNVNLTGLEFKRIIPVCPYLLKLWSACRVNLHWENKNSAYGHYSIRVRACAQLLPSLLSNQQAIELSLARVKLGHSIGFYILKFRSDRPMVLNNLFNCVFLIHNSFCFFWNHLPLLPALSSLTVMSANMI